MQFSVYRLPSGNDKLIDKGLAVECAKYEESLSYLKRVRVTLRDDLHWIMQGRSVFVGSCASDLKDCPDMLRIAFADVLAKLTILRSFGKNIGNAVMLQIVIEVSGLQIDLSRLGRDSHDVSSRAAGLDLHCCSLFHVPPAN